MKVVYKPEQALIRNGERYFIIVHSDESPLFRTPLAIAQWILELEAKIRQEPRPMSLLIVHYLPILFTLLCIALTDPCMVLFP